MVKRADTAKVSLWGEPVGAVAWNEERGYAAFEFEPAFLRSNLDIAPLQMPLAESAGQIYEFPTLKRETFWGLPGLLADSLPDKFGNAILDAWLTRHGRNPGSFSPVERLCYTGTRGMGALEFKPAMDGQWDQAQAVEISRLVALAQDVMAHYRQLDTQVGHAEDENAEALLDILRVGTSAGGARPKAVIAMNAEGRIVSGQGKAPKGYDYWILKFDGVEDLELGKTRGFGRIEYAYYLMAKAAGIEMSESRLLEENGRAHFITKRFDRVGGDKVHMQSLCAIAHFDFNMPGAYGYEQAFEIMRRLGLPKSDAVQQYRRMLFNVIARNQDDHTKNIAFLMGKDGEWRLSPAFDVNYAHNPKGVWTNSHQMTIAGKRDHFTMHDLLEVGRSIRITRPEEVIAEISEVVSHWSEFAHHAGIDDERRIADIAAQHRLKFVP